LRAVTVGMGAVLSIGYRDVIVDPSLQDCQRLEFLK
jgi:hypothetical protein